MRKLILLALGGAAAAYAIKSRGGQPAPVGPSASGYAPGPETAAEAPAVDEVEPGPEEAQAAEAATADTVESQALAPEDLADVRPDQLEGASTGEGVVPDVSDADPLVRQQEAAAAAQAGAVGGSADSVTGDVEPEMRPVVEGSGDAEETFEETEDQGR
jgi:hypothetical protein